MPFTYRDETLELNEATREAASGCFVELSDGFVHYELCNAEATDTVVFIHGFSVPYFIFDPTFEFLAQSGFRVLRYDLFGRGFSDRPDTDYNMDLLVRQLVQLLDALNLRQPVTLVSLSAGGPISAAFTARFPKRVHKLVLIDPVGARPFLLGRILKAAMPVLGELLTGVIMSIRLAKLIASSPFDLERIGDLGPGYITQMQLKGFKRALLSSIRNNLLGDWRGVYEEVGKIGTPVLLLWGRKDTAIPFKHSDVLRAAIPNLEFHAIQNAGHNPHYEKPEEVNPILLNFLKK